MVDIDDEVVVIINTDGSVYPFMEIFNPVNESDDDLVSVIKDHLEKKGRKLGKFYKTV